MTKDELKLKAAMLYLEARAALETGIERAKKMPAPAEKIADVLMIAAGAYETLRGLKRATRGEAVKRCAEPGCVREVHDGGEHDDGKGWRWINVPSKEGT